jgi:hypothetical protein
MPGWAGAGSGGGDYTQFNPWMDVLAGGMGGVAGAFPKTTTMTGSGTSVTDTNQAGGQNYLTNTTFSNLMDFLQHMSGTTTSAMTPTLSPETAQLMSQLAQRYSGLTTPSLMGYEANQTAQINANAKAQADAVDNVMAARGLSNSPAAATARANIEANRINQITGMRNQTPLLRNQLNLQNLAAGTGFLAAAPKGMTQTQQTQQDVTGQQRQTGEQWGTGSSTYQNYGYQSTQQQQEQQQKSGGGIGGALTGIASAVLPFLLASDAKLKKDIHPLDKASEKLMALKPRTWVWKSGKGEASGFIAQDLEEAGMPELVEDVGGIKMVNYAGVIPYLVEVVQNLSKESL